MKFLKASKNAIELICEKNESWRENFVFDLEIIPDKPKSLKRLIIYSQRKAQSWVMPWSDFLECETVGDIVIIPKDKFWKGAKQ